MNLITINTFLADHLKIMFLLVLALSIGVYILNSVSISVANKREVLQFLYQIHFIKEIENQSVKR